jgi:hypothetical protein
MKFKILVVGMCASVFFGNILYAQSHTSVPLDNQVYHILEQAEARGLCRPLSGVRPYTHSVIITAINEILQSEKLSKTERAILEQYLGKFAKPKTGIDWQRGAYYNEATIGNNNTVLSANAGVSADIEGSAGLYSSFEDRYFGTEIWIQAFLNGDLGSNVSYELNAEGGLMKAPREHLGKYNTYYKGFEDDKKGEFVNREIDVFSEPLTHFPYAYKKRWDGSIYFFSGLSNFESWPDGIAGSYNLKSELTGSFLENKLIMRLGRLSHEWGSASLGSSLAFNQMARPFLGVETEFNPVPWLGIASLTGILEYNNLYGIKESSLSNQNAFSITMMQFRYKNYLFFDFVGAVVWPKRFELGYISPITNSFFYQNNIGDFDNMAMTFNLKAQYPGVGNIWFSLFLDELNLLSKVFELDRTMIAGQAGLNIPLPFLAFSSLKLSYTKVNPYTYTHNRNFTPWYGDIPMETGYTNNGVSLGYYLPPNADEILVQFKTAPTSSLITHLQYQLIRHGATHGDSAVDGSHLLSELDPDGRDSNPVLKRHFLRDGAYQWSHIARVGAEWNLPGLPVSLFGEAGVIIAYFTNIEGGANDGSPHDYSIIDTAVYPQSTGFVAKIGLRVFSR